CCVRRAGVASATVGLREDTVALQVDDLLGLRDREGNRVFPALMGIGPNEAVFFHAFRGVLLNDPGGLVEAVVSVRSRPDAVALVLTRWRGRPVGLASSAAGEAAPCRFEFREHGSRLGLAVSAAPMPVAPTVGDYCASAPACRPLAGRRWSISRRRSGTFNTRTARARSAPRGCPPGPPPSPCRCCDPPSC